MFGEWKKLSRAPHIVRTSDHSDLEKREVDKGEN